MISKEDHQFIASCKYVVVVFDGDRQVHWCLYENKPSEDSIKDLYRELMEDSEFGLIEAAKSGRLTYVVEEIGALA